MADPRVRIIVDAVTDAAERQMRKLQGTVKETGKEGSKAAGGFDSLKTAVAGIGAAVGVATTAFIALKKAYDFGKEGAAILQTRDSFDKLMSSMGVAPGILDRLRDASLGTVDDMTIMSSTMTLLAGTSEELGTAMVEASPKLMEIAKAAHKLNPAAGDVEYFYNSIASGIKRSSPMILDNLGLVVKIGDVTQAWADANGVAVESMTAEQKQLALLEGALQAGGRLVEQVGGSVDEMGDSFAQAEVRIKNATDTLKTQAAPAIADIVQFLADMVDGEERVVAASEELRKSSKNYDVYLDAVLRAAKANHQLSESDIDVIKRQAEKGEAFHDTVYEMGILTEAQYNAARETDRVSEKWANYAEALKRDAQPAVKDLSQDTQDLAGNVELVANMMEQRAARAADDFKGSLDLLHAAMRGEVGEAIDDYESNLADLEQQLADGAITHGEYQSAVEELTDAFHENNRALAYNIAEKQILDALEKGLIEDVNNSGTAYDEATQMLWGLAEGLGLTDEATVNFMEAVQNQTQAMIDGEGPRQGHIDAIAMIAEKARDAAGGVEELNGQINALPDSKHIDITVQTTYTFEGTEGGQEGGMGGGQAYNYQHGGQFTVRGPAGVDNVPIRFNATRGEVVTITPVGGTPPANPTTNNNYNLNIHTSAPAESALSDFHTMRALAGA